MKISVEDEFEGADQLLVRKIYYKKIKTKTRVIEDKGNEMSKPKLKTIVIQTGVNPSFLENTLTEDTTTLASLFDLIDNSIDAARDHLLTTKPKLDEYGLPKTYVGYRIQVRIDNDSIRILDNCLGIEEATLSKKAFYIAETSDHSFGIGHYGLGFKRSLLKFGTNYALATDTGNALFKMQFGSKNFGGNGRRKLTADLYPSGGKRKVLVSVSNLKPDIKYEISSDEWFENAIKELCIRYAVYIKKGLKISVRSILHGQCREIISVLPSLRTNGKFPPTKTPPLNIQGVQIYIESGIHHEYRFPSEEDHSLSKNRSLTKSFGLYFICNDRIIVANSLSPALGWTATWHSEYNGFVCLVKFVSEDSSKMPWNTAKTEMRIDSTIFLKVKEQLQPIADSYRKDIKRRYPPKAQRPSSVTQETDLGTKVTSVNNASSDGLTHAADDARVTKPFRQATNNQHLHVKNWSTLLPKNFPHSDDNILNALIIEAIDLEITNAPYASAMLYRALMEAALKRFVYKTKNFQNVKDHFYSSLEGKKKKHTTEQKKNQGINPPIILPWLSDNTALFESSNKTRLVNSIKKAKEHMPFLNGVVHGNQLMDAGKPTAIRNDTVELLQFLITKNLSPDFG